jgi:hypothetical protein
VPLLEIHNTLPENETQNCGKMQKNYPYVHKEKSKNFLEKFISENLHLDL